MVPGRHSADVFAGAISLSGSIAQGLDVAASARNIPLWQLPGRSPRLTTGLRENETAGFGRQHYPFTPAA
jgi:hypothetical protein